MYNNIQLRLLLLLLIKLIVDIQSTSVEKSDINGNETTVKDEKLVCEIADQNEANCEKCVQKGPGCFWCESLKKCIQYHWTFPNCPLKYVRKNNCWADWTIIFALAAALFAIIASAVCCCFIYFCMLCNDCCRKLREAEDARRSKKAAEDRIAMQQRQQQRRMERQAQRDSIRQKYGIPMTSSAFERIKDQLRNQAKA